MENNITFMNICDLDLNDNIIGDFYLVVFKDLLDNYKVYFTNIEGDNNLYLYNKNGESVLLAEYDEENEKYYSCYGEIDSVTCILDLILTYGIVSFEYKKEVINEIINNFLKDYIELKKNDTIKRLELKR